MRTKDEIFKDSGFTDQYNPHGGILMDTKDVLFLEVIIDIRDILDRFFTAANFLVDDILTKK